MDLSHPEQPVLVSTLSMAGRTTQKSHETESSALISLSLLLGEDPGHLFQQPQATSSQDQEPLGSPSLSEPGSEYRPFFHIPEQPLAMEELAQQVELCPGHKAGRSCREGLFLEESAPPSGFFPYYRSQEELLNCTTPQGCWCLGTRDRFPGSGAQDGCCKVTWDGCPVNLKRPQEGRQHQTSGMLQIPIPSEPLARWHTSYGHKG